MFRPVHPQFLPRCARAHPPSASWHRPFPGCRASPCALALRFPGRSPPCHLERWAQGLAVCTAPSRPRSLAAALLSCTPRSKRFPLHRRKRDPRTTVFSPMVLCNSPSGAAHPATARAVPPDIAHGTSAGYRASGTAGRPFLFVLVHFAVLLPFFFFFLCPLAPSHFCFVGLWLRLPCTSTAFASGSHHP